MQEKRISKRKERVGTVISDKMDKTITISVSRVTRHAMYDKTIRMHSKFKVHDEKDEAHVGDVVRIEETRPISKTKRWRLVEIITKAKKT